MRVTSKPHLFAVHIEPMVAEFRQSAMLWRAKDRFSSRTCIVYNNCPNPFKAEEPRMFQQVTEPDHSSADYLDKYQVCFQVGDAVFEIPSPNGRIARSSFPPPVSSPNFVLIGGLLENGGCLPNAFDSILAKSLSRGGRLTVRIPLDCVYSSGETDKLELISAENDFSRSLSSKFGTEWMIALDGTLIAGREDAPASLQWFSTASERRPRQQ